MMRRYAGGPLSVIGGAIAGLLERAQLRCGDAAQFLYPSGGLDDVFMSFTLELFDTLEIPKVLREC